jgi:lipoprotein signal peptidase
MFLFKNTSNTSIILLGGVIVAYSLLVSELIMRSNLSFVINSSPSFFVFGFILGIFFTSLLVGIGFYLGFYRTAKIPFVFIISGALSNLIEMALNQHVVDYIDIFIAKLNLADIQIYLGLAVIIIGRTKHKIKTL